MTGPVVIVGFLSSPQFLIAAAVVYGVVVLASLYDIARRPRELLLTQRRWLWMLITLIVVPAGFALYLLFGRLPPEETAE